MAGPLAQAAIALGSNLGDCLAHLEFALQRLTACLADVRVSRIRETLPVGVGPQPPFLNAALVGLTRRQPLDLLSDLLAIERERGRERPHPGAPRTLDLDLILYGDTVIDTPALTLPHPRFRQRAFVLEPLAEIAPEMVDPVTGKSVGELWTKFSCES
jgi:2-amino-4-hydroxy-6-hydroxymethyldihydropteridine diphosphokinase